MPKTNTQNFVNFCSQVGRLLQILLAAGLLLATAGSHAVQQISLKMATVYGPAGIRAEAVNLNIKLAGSRPAATLRIGRLTLPQLDEAVTNVTLRCAGMTLTNHRITCPKGELDLQSPRLAESTLPITFDYQIPEQQLSLELPRLVSTTSSADGNRASEGLTLALQLALQQEGEVWRFSGALQADAGQVYIDPVFLDLDKMPIALKFSGKTNTQTARIQVDNFELTQPGVLTARGALNWNAGLEAATVDIRQAQLPAAFTTYAQPFLIGTTWGSLSTDGTLQTKIKYDAKGWSRIQVAGGAIDLSDEKNRFSVSGGALDVDWQRDIAQISAQPSMLSWDQAKIYQIALGPTRVHWRMGGDDGALTQPVSVPVFDGHLNIASAQAMDLTGENPSIDFNARLTPVKLARLSQALGWPEFQGSLSGELPRLSYTQGELVLAGGLKAKAFGGEINIERLNIANPLSERPRLRADATARSLDLETMTSAFSFGRITGKLDADITGLRMLGWSPVAFKAWLRTPENDDSRHRISQNAIDDLASLGGGGAGLVSRGFLGLFDDFAYDRLGLGCAMQQGVCAMRGLGPADNGGFVIVRGSWLPRIDVVGFNRLVSWPVLLEQLKSVSTGDGPVINPDKPPGDKPKE